MRQVDEGALYANSITLIYRRLIRDAHAKKLFRPISDAGLARYLREVTSHSVRVGVAQATLRLERACGRPSIPSAVCGR